MTAARAAIPGLFFADGAPIDAERAARVDASILRGHFALHRVDGGSHELVRDPLGVHKLFFTIDEDDVRSATFFAVLRREGVPASRIWSVPSGHRIVVSPAERALTIEKIAGPTFAEDTRGEIRDHAQRVAVALDRTFRMLAGALAGEERVFVTLSGGLDSTTIAVLAKERFPRVVGVTFAMDGEHGEGSDLWAARQVARSLGIDLLEVIATREEILEELDVALTYGQDWRDFNVHCALVNAAIAERLPIGSVVLTGDGMNELMADYRAVSIEGTSYYDLPRLPPGKLRRFLVTGLDSGDREVGVFARRGIRVVQPYLLCADAYAALPEAMVGSGDAKQELVRHALGARIPGFVYARPKVRAQVGSSHEVAGTLGALARRGIDQDALRARFCELFAIHPDDQRRMIRAGLYRFPIRWPEETPS